MNNSVVLCTICFVSVYSDTKWGLQIHVCFTNELGEILSYIGFSAGGIDYPRVRSI